MSRTEVLAATLATLIGGPPACDAVRRGGDPSSHRILSVGYGSTIDDRRDNTRGAAESALNPKLVRALDFGNGYLQIYLDRLGSAKNYSVSSRVNACEDGNENCAEMFGLMRMHPKKHGGNATISAHRAAYVVSYLIKFRDGEEKIVAYAFDKEFLLVGFVDEQ